MKKAVLRDCRTEPQSALLAAVLIVVGSGVGAKTIESRPPLESFELDRNLEIAIARSAAPASISKGARILVLTHGGYVTAAKGGNGFTCLVERSWNNAFDDAEFWNVRIRVPICFNSPAATTVLPEYLRRTQWVLAGSSPASMASRERRLVKLGKMPAPAPGSTSFMMSRLGWLHDEVGPAGPHIMMFVKPGVEKSWGADLPGSPVASTTDAILPVTNIYIGTRRWSDGTLVQPK